MRHFHRILGFVAVSFVLVFIAKVNKGDLYSAYFKTIADVEVRNSTALTYDDLHAAPATHSTESRDLLRLGAGNADLANFCFDVHSEFASAYKPTFHESAAPTMALRCFLEVAPRAPGA